MKTAPANVVSFLAGLTPSSKAPWRGDLYTITLLNGTIYRLTTADRDIVSGGNTYSSAGVILSRSNIRITSQLEVDNLVVIFSAAAKLSGTQIALLATQGTFFGARLQLDHLVGPDPSTAIGWGPVKAFYEGRIADVRISGQQVQMTVESEVGALDRFGLPQFRFDLMCSHAVYDPNCALVKATFTDAATVSNNSPTTTTVPSTTAALIARATDYYTLGVVVFTSGALSGVRRAVKAFSVSGGVATSTLAQPLPSVPVVGVSFTVYPGCDRKQTTCVNKFSNLVNFRGFPHIPSPEGAA